MDDLHEQMDDQTQLDDAFSRPIGQDMYTTDADLESGIETNSFEPWFSLFVYYKELAGLAEEEFGLESNPVSYDFRAPSVPVHPIVRIQFRTGSSRICSFV